MQHAQQSSSLLTPDHVPCVYLSALSCSLSFGTRKESVQEVRKEARIQDRKTKVVTFRLPPKKLRRFFARKKKWDGSVNRTERKRRRARNSILASSTDKLARNTATSTPRAFEPEPELYGFPPHIQNQRLEYLTHAALDSLLGLRKRFADFRLESPQSPSLLDIAPAVLNAVYFQVCLIQMHIFNVT